MHVPGVLEGGGECGELIALTGYGQSGDTARALDAGFEAHLVKPATAAQLFDVIAR